MAAYRRVYDSRHLEADCQEPGSAPEPYARQSSMGYLYLCYLRTDRWKTPKHKAATVRRINGVVTIINILLLLLLHNLLTMVVQ